MDYLPQKKIKLNHLALLDNSLSGGTSEEVVKIRGNVKKVGSKFTYSGTISAVLSPRSKVQVIRGETDGEALQILGGKVLVHARDARNDRPKFILTMNLINRKRVIRTGSDLTIDHLARLNNFV